MKNKSSESKIKHLVPNNPEYDRLTMDPEEVAAERRAIKNTLYDSSYKTAAGHWKQRDEPDEEEQFRQADRIRRHLFSRQQQASRERLKKKGAVPTKQGRKLFDQFMEEANLFRKKESSIHPSDLKQIYLAARSLDDFEKWIHFIANVG